MCISSFQNSIRNTATVIFALCFSSLLFAQEQGLDLSVNRGNQEEDLSALQKQARSYRNQGLQLQRIGNIDAAMSLYQKAIELDPAYAVAYNDAGIIYEAKGLIDQAEESYLKCIGIDPNYLAAYTNLAFLYEHKRDLDKAAFYWKKRVELGSPGDAWTERAGERLNDIEMVLSKNPLEEARQQEVIGRQKIEAIQKSKDNKALAKSYFQKAKIYLKNQDMVAALKIAIDAYQLDPANAEIEEFIEKTQKILLSR